MKKKIFISHASKDKPIISAFIDDILVGALAVKISEIFCTTTDGTRIESGEDWRNEIKNALIDAKIVVLIITPNYKESEICLNEMGAAWVLSSKVISLIVEPIDYESVGILQQPKQIERLADEKSLDRLRDIIQDSLDIPTKDIKSDRWTLKKFEFIETVKNHLNSNPFNPPLGRDEYDRLLNERNNITNAIKTLIAEKNELEKLIKELKQAKDKDDVREIEKRFRNTNLIDEFHELCKEVSNSLSKLTPIVRGIIYVSFSNKEISVEFRGRGWENEINDAISRDLISQDLDADWYSTSLMRDLSTALLALRTFILENDSDVVFHECYEDDYDAPLSMNNLDFWEEVFSLDIYLS